MPTYQGRSYSLIGSPELWLADDDGSPAPPEAVDALSRRVLRKAMRQLGLKPPGRPKKAQTVGERRLDLFDQGVTLKEICDRENIDEDAALHSMRLAKRRRASRSQ